MAEVLSDMISSEDSKDMGRLFDIVVSPAGKYEEHDVLKAYILDVEKERLLWPLPISFADHPIVGKAPFAVTRRADLGMSCFLPFHILQCI